MWEVFEAYAGEKPGADAVGNRAHHIGPVVGRVDVAAEGPFHSTPKRPAGRTAQTLDHPTKGL